MVKKLTKLLLEGHKRYLFYDHIAEFLIANDVVPVVRCKDCKHWCTVDCIPNYGSCSKLEDRYKEDCESSFDETTRFDDFCSYGERRNDATD